MTIRLGWVVACGLAIGVAATGCNKGKTAEKCATDWPEAIPLAACMAPVDGWKDSDWEDTIVELDIAGTITKVGKGVPSEDCVRTASGVWRYLSADKRPSGSWLEMTTSEGRTWVVAMKLGDNALVAKVGDEVRVTYDAWDGGHGGATTGVMTVKRKDDIIAFFGQHHRLENIGKAIGVGVTAGDVSCQNPDECGSWEFYDLKIKESDLLMSLPYGDSVDSAGLRYLHGGYSAAKAKKDLPNSCRHFGSDSGAMLGVVRLP